MLSHLSSIEGFIILLNISIQDICKIHKKIKSLQMMTPISKHNITKDKHKHCPLQSFKKKER